MTAQDKSATIDRRPPTADRPIRVHFDLQDCRRRCGSHTYETEIYRRVCKFDDIDADPFYFEIRQKPGLCEIPADLPVRRIHFPPSMISFHQSFSLAKKIASYVFRALYTFVSFNTLTGGKSGDIFVFFDNAVPALRVNGKIIAVLHDIIPLRLDSYKGEGAENFRKEAEALVSRADQIVTISEYSKKEIADEFHVDPGKIEIVYCAIDPEKFSREKSSAEYLRGIRSKYGLPEKYILHFGGSILQKNIPNLLRAYAMLPESVKNEYSLVKTNPDNEIRQLACELGITDRMIYAENIPDEDKAGIYQLASLMAWPSYIEGFGLPILEAQASGVPVVSSNTSSMPEVGGDSVIYFDPYDVSGMSEAMRRCLTDESLHSELVSKGYENIKRFSWDKSAEKFHDIIMSL